MKIYSVVGLLLLPLLFLQVSSTEPNLAPVLEEIPTSLAHAYAHNDYWNERPLLDALACGFTFAEVDVHLVDGELVVAR